MRSVIDEDKLFQFMEEIGRRAKGPGRVYLVGGSTALLFGYRSQTIDIDLKLDPEPQGIFEAISVLKDRLGVNVEIASPDHFIPAVPGWRERSQFIVKEGQVEFYHYDLYGQALAKIQRGHRTDLMDVHSLVSERRIELEALRGHFSEIKGELNRYPALNAAEFERRVEEFIALERER